MGTGRASRAGICSMMVLRVRMTLSAAAAFLPCLGLTCSSSSSTCSLKMFDLNVSAVYAPSCRLAAGRLLAEGLLEAAGAFAGAGALLAASSTSSSSSSLTSSSRGAPMETSLSAPSSSTPLLPLSSCAASLPNSAKLPSLSSSLCSSFLRFVAGRAMLGVGIADPGCRCLARRDEWNFFVHVAALGTAPYR